MLKIIKNPKRKAPPLVNFNQPFTNQKLGVELIIAMNMAGREILTAPECGVAQRILVIKEKSQVFFNPVIEDNQIAPESFAFGDDDVILCIRYANYMGNERINYFKDNDGKLLQAINKLNGIK